MASPIIKIKRGNGAPTGAGITAGEFAFDRNTGILYIGATGGYCGIDATGAKLANNDDMNIIKVGMQISNDTTFAGASPTLDANLGYSNYTVPTTRAVREYIAAQITSAAAGIVFQAGGGINVTSAGTNPITYTVSNTGVLFGYTAIDLSGNYIGLSRIQPEAKDDLLSLYADSGIRLVAENSGGKDQIRIINYGVTGINGVTGNIKAIEPIISLEGYTAAVGTALQSLLTQGSPIVITTSGGGKIDISHSNSGVASGTYPGVVSNVPQTHTITVNSTGHITSLVSSNLDFSTSVPVNFEEAVRDAAFPGITSGQNKNYGIEFVYSDNTDGLLRAYNRGITSLSGSVGGVGLSGAVALAAGTNITITPNFGTNALQIAYSGNQFTTINANKASSVYPQSGFYVGGITGPGGSQFVTADAATDALNLYAGKGIGISAGELSAGVDGILLWNTGVNMLSAYNAGSLLGGTGFSGNVELVAGTNILFTRGSGSTENQLTISSTAGGGGGAVSWIQADYTTEPGENYAGTYASDGITGAVNISGTNGLVTRQDTGSNTKNGTVEIGLSSKLTLPSGKYLPGDVAGESSIIELPTQRTVGTPELPPLNNGDYPTMPPSYATVITDKILGGLTAQLFYGTGNGGQTDYYDPIYTTEERNNSYPGKILILAADQGLFWDGVGAAQTTQGMHAEVRLLGYPNPENIAAEIERVFVPNQDAGGVEDCDGGSCVGFPPTLPGCAVYNDSTEQYDRVNLWLTEYAENTGTVAVNGNLIARDAVYVERDIWINGQIIDAKTGCLYAGGTPGNGGGTITTPGGKLGLTGDLVVDGSIYVHGGTAFFNVRDFSTESALLKVGGLSAAASGYSVEMGGISSSVSGYTGDRGLVLFHYSKSPYSPIKSTVEAVAAAKTGFVGIDSSEGVFAFYESVANVTTSGNPGNVYTYVTGGQVGAARFREINNVGITADTSGVIFLKANQNDQATNITNQRLSGHVDLIGPTSAGNKAVIQLEDNARLKLASTIGSGALVAFTRGITFDATSSNLYDPQNSLRFNYNGTDSVQRRVSIPDPGAAKGLLVAHTGRVATTANGLLNSSYATTNGQYTDLPQVLYNTTLSDGTVIDCGTY